MTNLDRVRKRLLELIEKAISDLDNYDPVKANEGEMPQATIDDIQVISGYLDKLGLGVEGAKLEAKYVQIGKWVTRPAMLEIVKKDPKNSEFLSKTFGGNFPVLSNQQLAKQERNSKFIAAGSTRELIDHLHSIRQSLKCGGEAEERLVVNVQDCEVMLDGKQYPVSDNAALLFEGCWKNHPHPFKASELDGDVRPANVIASLPRQLKSVLRSQRGVGCTLELPPHPKN